MAHQEVRLQVSPQHHVQYTSVVADHLIGRYRFGLAYPSLHSIERLSIRPTQRAHPSQPCLISQTISRRMPRYHRCSLGMVLAFGKPYRL